MIESNPQTKKQELPVVALVASSQDNKDGKVTKVAEVVIMQSQDNDPCLKTEKTVIRSLCGVALLGTIAAVALVALAIWHNKLSKGQGIGLLLGGSALFACSWLPLCTAGLCYERRRPADYYI